MREPEEPIRERSPSRPPARLTNSQIVLGVATAIMGTWLALTHWWLLVLATIIVVGVLTGGKYMSRWQTLGPGQAALVVRLNGSLRPVVEQGRIFLLPGERVQVVLSLRHRTVDFSIVDCHSADGMPLTARLVGVFQIRAQGEAVWEVNRRFGNDDAGMDRYVADILHQHVKWQIGRTEAAAVDPNSAILANAARRSAAPDIAALGLELVALSMPDLVMPPAWKEAREREMALRAHEAALAIQLSHQRMKDESRLAQELEEADRKAKAAADRDAYAERQRLEIQAERQALARENQRLLAELEVLRLREILAVEGDFHAQRMQQLIIERLPEILEAKGKLVPNLRTYIAGEHEQGLPGLIAGLSTFGPDIMEAVRELMGATSAALPASTPPPITSREHPEPRSEETG